MLKEQSTLSGQERRELASRLIQGVVNRATTLSFVYAAVFTIYGFSSLSFIQQFDSTITLSENVWPRIVFNTLPFLLMGLYLKRGNGRPELKVWIWTVALPGVFLAACLIHIWEIMWHGSGEIYFYVHAANTFILTTALIVVSPPPKFIVGQTVCFLGFVLLPIAIILFHIGDFKLLQFLVSENLIAIPVVIYMSHLIYQLRYKIAYFDLQKRKQTSSFLGPAIAGAIYEERDFLFESRTAEALVVQMDIRDFTNFYKTRDAALTREFMQGYHALVSREIGRHGGFWHKSVGDAQVITFGAMDPDVADLSNLPGLETELKEASLRRRRCYFQKGMSAIAEIIENFEALKESLEITDTISLGVGIAYGPLEIRIQGDASFKRELDIDGDVVIRCSRLEAFSKTVRREKAPASSVLIVSPELSEAAKEHQCEYWPVKTHGIRNYPDIEYLFYRVFHGKGKNRRAA